MGEQRIHLHFRTFPEDHLWVGECIELGVSTSAETQEQADSGIEEATHLYLQTLAEHGELLRILAERGVPLLNEGENPRDRIEARTLALPAAVP
jgi:predicted RNase H-like HicB family nuclease